MTDTVSRRIVFQGLGVRGVAAALMVAHFMWAGTAQKIASFAAETGGHLTVDDLAAACFHLLSLDSPPDWVNVGVGEDISILGLAQLVAETVGYKGQILTDPSKPDGTPRKLMDISLIRSTGWNPSIPFRDGLAAAYQDFLAATAAGAARL